MINSVVIVLAALGALVWFGFLVVSSTRGRGAREAPPNLSVFQTDEELETRRLDKVLAVSVVLSAFMAVSLPVYYLGDFDRQAQFEEDFAHEAIERGEHIIEEFGCAVCHGSDFGGGAATFIEKRTGVRTSWVAPSLNDIFYRYEEDEIRFWVVFGRANTPMPAWGLEGGGPMNDQQVEDVIAYLRDIQRDQSEVVNRARLLADLALGSLAGADDAVAAALADQVALIAEIEAATELAPVLASLAEQAEDVLDVAGGGIDVDQDGLSDAAEQTLSALSAQAATAEEEAAAGAFDAQLKAVDLDPQNPETQSGQSDGATAAKLVADLARRAANFEITLKSQDRLLERAKVGLGALEEAAEERRWEFDFEAVAGAMGTSVEEAEHTVGLFLAYCSRCHTSGYSAGVIFTQEAGSGGFGPALFKGRVGKQFLDEGLVAKQFLDEEQLLDFLKKGSTEGKAYGISGVGRGFMPAFGGMLTEDDLELLAVYLFGGVLR